MNPITVTLVPLLHLVATFGATSTPAHAAGLAPVGFSQSGLPASASNSGAQGTEAQPAKIDASIWRYETGKRMREMERAWATADDARRAEVVKTVERSVAFFFRGNMAGVASALDAARRQLGADGKEVTDLERAGDAFAMVPSSRLVALGTERIEVRVVPIYGDWDVLKDVSITLRYSDLETGAVYQHEYPCGKYGVETSLDLEGHSAGVFLVTGTLKLGVVAVSIGAMQFEIVSDLEARLTSLKGAVGRRPKLAPTVAARTAYQYLRLLEDLAEGKTPETDYPAGKLLERAELLAAGDADPQRTGEPKSGRLTAAEWIASPGERWLSLPIGRRAVKVRLFVPDGLKPDASTPLVVALHGAGGSHNMFFDGYGDGLAVDLARARGWVLIAPQVGLFGCPVVEILDGVAGYLPVDPERVFLLGHSMGAGAVVRAANGAPDRFRAISALGGGGKAGEAMASIPAFLGAGASDFGKRGVDALAARLTTLGATELVHRTYADTEHLLIVQRALPDVYAFFDAHLRGDAESAK